MNRYRDRHVYLGQHIYLKSYAAVKVPHTQLHNRDARLFVQEAQTLVRLSHPHIVRVLDSATLSDRTALPKRSNMRASCSPPPSNVFQLSSRPL